MSHLIHDDEEMAHEVGGPVFVLPPVTFSSINYVRLTVPSMHAMFPVGRFPGGVAVHLPLATHLRLEVDGVLRPGSETYRNVELRDSGSSSILIDGLPFDAVRGMRRLGIRRLNHQTLVLVMGSAVPPPAAQLPRPLRIGLPVYRHVVLPVFQPQPWGMPLLPGLPPNNPRNTSSNMSSGSCIDWP